MNITTLERKLLEGIDVSDYNDLTGETWTWDAIDNAGMSTKQGRGVIASLSKKGLVQVDNNEEGTDFKESYIFITREGLEVMLEENIGVNTKETLDIRG